MLVSAEMSTLGDDLARLKLVLWPRMFDFLTCQMTAWQDRGSTPP